MEKYGMLTPIEPTEKRYNKEVVWKFRCDCGEIVERSLSAVKRNSKLGYIVSCGKHTTENKHKKSTIAANIANKKNIINGANMSIHHGGEAYKNSKTGIKGVSYDKTKKKYIAQLQVAGKHYFCGRYDTTELAKEAYEAKKKEILKKRIIE